MLYRLLHGVDEGQARLMVWCVVISMAIAFVIVVPESGALRLLLSSAAAPSVEKRQLESLAKVLLDLHGHGLLVAEVFWGLWLIPFGVLVKRSGFLPPILGVLLIVNGCAYFATFLTGLLLPAYSRAVHNWALIPELGELFIMVWLLVKNPSPLSTTPRVILRVPSVGL
jgi:hypothetical protein